MSEWEGEEGRRKRKWKMEAGERTGGGGRKKRRAGRAGDGESEGDKEETKDREEGRAGVRRA